MTFDPMTAAIIGAIATVLVLFGVYRLRSRFDKAEPKIWTAIAEEAIEMAEKDALEKEQYAKKAAAEAIEARAKIAAFRERIGAAAA